MTDVLQMNAHKVINKLNKKLTESTLMIRHRGYLAAKSKIRCDPLIGENKLLMEPIDEA